MAGFEVITEVRAQGPGAVTSAFDALRDARASQHQRGWLLRYQSGESVIVGDVVQVTFAQSPVQARVVAVLAPGSAEALSWNAPEGGVMVDSATTGLVLWRAPDEDMTFLHRGP
jgi:hypothetical protein